MSRFLVWLGWIAILAPVACILLLPLLPRAGSHGPSPRMTSGNNLKGIALAMHNYHDTYHQFPRAYWLTESGERTLSWRVAILPFIEHSPLFEQYRPDEPWSSLANREVGKARIPSYLGPWNRKESSREAGYLVVTGPGTLFEEGKDFTFRDCADGSSNTILAVEVKHSGIHWNKPRDLDIRTMILQINGSESNAISSPWKQGAQVAFADGSVRLLTNETLASTLRAMLTRAGGETLSPGDLP